METQITEDLRAKFEQIRSVYTAHGANLFTPWQGWPTLNKFYPSGDDSDYLVFDEHLAFVEFVGKNGKHPVLGSHSHRGDFDFKSAFNEISSNIDLTFIKEIDLSNSSMHYKGCKRRYYRIS